MRENRENTTTYREIWYEKWVAVSDFALQIYKSCIQHKTEKREYKEIYVVFRGGERVWWQKFLNKKFTHVFMLQNIIKQNVGSGVLQVEFTTRQIEHTHLPLASLESYIKELKKNGCTVLKHTNTCKPSHLGSFIPKLVPYNCVSLTKQQLGIRAFGRITPRQLFRHLLTKPHVQVQ